MNTQDLRRAHYNEVLPTLAGNRLRVYEAMVLCGPCTPKELAQRIGWDKCSVRPRCVELRDMGLVRETGERRNHEHVLEAVANQEQAEMSFGLAPIERTEAVLS